MAYGFTGVFLGNLGRDVEIKYVGQGDQTKLAKFSVAVQAGKDEVEWVNVSAFGSLAAKSRCATAFCRQYSWRASALAMKSS